MNKNVIRKIVLIAFAVVFVLLIGVLVAWKMVPLRHASNKTAPVSVTTPGVSLALSPPQTMPDVIPSGWQVLKDEKYGIQAFVPSKLEYSGCREPITLGIVRDDVYGLGTYWKPCAKNTSPLDERFDDMFSGYVFTILENVRSAEEIQVAFNKAWGSNCTMKSMDLKTGTFVINDSQTRVNQWAPRSCGDFTDDPSIVHSFYNAQTKTFVIWKQEPNTFSTAPGQSADAQVKIGAYSPPFAGWKTYVNEAYGFSIMYPPDLAYDSASGTTDFERSFFALTFGTPNDLERERHVDGAEGLPSLLAVSASVPNLEAYAKANLTAALTGCTDDTTNGGRVTVGGIIATKCTGLMLGSFPSMGIGFTKGRQIYYYLNSDQYSGKTGALVDKMISTFRFLK